MRRSCSTQHGQLRPERQEEPEPPQACTLQGRLSAAHSLVRQPCNRDHIAPVRRNTRHRPLGTCHLLPPTLSPRSSEEHSRQQHQCPRPSCLLTDPLLPHHGGVRAGKAADNRRHTTGGDGHPPQRPLALCFNVLGSPFDRASTMARTAAPGGGCSIVADRGWRARPAAATPPAVLCAACACCSCSRRTTPSSGRSWTSRTWGGCRRHSSESRCRSLMSVGARRAQGWESLRLGARTPTQRHRPLLCSGRGVTPQVPAETAAEPDAAGASG